MTMPPPVVEPQPVPELRVEPAGEAQGKIVGNLLRACLVELGAPSAYPWLAAYWTEPGRFPYLLIADGEVAGFALVRRVPGRFDFEMAEFYVLPAWRRRGLGRMAVNRLFHLHPGRWRLDVGFANARGAAFWSKVLRATARQQGDRLRFEVVWPPARATLSPRQRRLVQSWYAAAILIAIGWWLAGYSLAATKMFWLVVAWPVAVLYGLSLGQPVSTGAAWRQRDPAYFEHLVVRHPWLRPWAFLCALLSLIFCAAALTRRIDMHDLLGYRGIVAAVFVTLAPLIVATQIEQFRDFAGMDDIL